jgi:hypothetical protein
MRKGYIVTFMLLVSVMAYGQLFINEIDYDQVGTDATEFIEIAGPAGTYNSVNVELVNGNNGGSVVYLTADLGNITLTDESNGYGFYVVGASTVANVDLTPSAWPTTNIIQNGAPDAVVLKINGAIVDAVSYEGEMIDADGNAMESIEGDFAGADSSANRLGLNGSPWLYGPFSPGAVNIGQTFDPTANFNPTANAGVDQSVESGATVTLDGTGSVDSDGTIEAYLWTQVSGSTVTLSNANTATATFVVPTVTETTSWVFSLTVTDNDGATGVDEVTITVAISADMTIAVARTQTIGTLVTVTGVVNSVNFSSSGTEHTFEDATAGIDLYFSGAVIALELGDEITVTGVIDDYSGKLEVMPSAESDIVVNSSGNVIEPQVITAHELANNGENYESELIRINNVSNVGTGDGWPAAGVNANLNITDNGTDITVMRIDKETEVDGSTEPIWPVDVVGVVSEFSGTYQLMPRLLADFLTDLVVPTFENGVFSPGFVTSSNEIEVSIDIVPGDETQTIASANIMYGTDGTMLNESEMWLDNGTTWMGIIPAQAANSFLEYEIVVVTNDNSSYSSYTYQIAIASATTTEIASIQANPVVGDVVTIEGVITVGSGLLQTGLTNAYIQDASGHGINLFDYDEVQLTRGDRIRAVGMIEVYGTTVEVKDFSYQTISVGNDLPAAVIQTIPEANQALYEGTLVSVTGEITDTYSAGGGQNVIISDGSETATIRIWESTGVDVTNLTIGTSWSFTGIGSSYNGAFQMLVAYDGDIENSDAINALGSTPERFALNAAYPNPFNPMTTFSWTLNESTDMTIRVVDIAGREVALLANQRAEAGSYSMTWNASALSSGIYFIQLSTPSQSEIQKVMLVK